MSEVLPHSLHFVGIGGIGMSGLAQMARSLGHHVSGSDRALHAPENQAVFQALKAQGIELYDQDGSRFADGNPPPEALVYSTAIEEGNPDFAAGAGIPRLHRSAAMGAAVGQLKAAHTVAVTGTCGKTSVSAWLAESLAFLKQDPGVLSCGLINVFRSEVNAGNYVKGNGRYFVLEADESDKSLVNYSADSAMILNIGTDHYPKEELARVFGTFLSSIRDFAVIEEEAYQAILEHYGPLPSSLKIHLFSLNQNSSAVHLAEYSSTPAGSFARFSTSSRKVRLPGPGIHQAANALAIFVELLALGFSEEEACAAVESFHGVWRRFDPAGKNDCGVQFFDDYAHNVEKIISCLRAGREISSGKVIAFFQPHGYGPLGFMREELFRALEQELLDKELFAFLPVFYAGGTSSFKPSSDEVVDGYRAEGNKHYFSMKDREDALHFICQNTEPGDVVLIMGARDNSLSSWAKQLAVESCCGKELA